MDPVFVDSVQKIKDLAPYMPDMFEGVAYTDMQANFINEISAHFVGGSYEAGYFSAENPDLSYDVFAVPGPTANDPAYVSVYADMNFSISATTKKQDAALRFIKYLAPPNLAPYRKRIAMVSALPGCGRVPQSLYRQGAGAAKEFYPLHLPGRFPLMSSPPARPCSSPPHRI